MIRTKGGTQKEGKGRLARIAKKQGIQVIDLIKNTIVAEKSVYKAAVKLKVSRTTLAYHLKQAGIRVCSVISIEFISTGKNV